MKKIVVVNQPREGGIYHYTFALCNALAAAGCQVSLLTTPGEYELANVKRGFEIVPLLQTGPRRNRLPQKLARRAVARLRPNLWHQRLGKQIGQYVQAQKAEVVHQQWVSDVDAEPVMWASMRRQLRATVPLVYTAHNVWPHEASPRTEEQYKALYTHPDRIVVHGKTLQRQMVTEAAVPERKISVVPHGNYHYLAEAAPAISAAEARARLNLPDEAKVVLFLGYIRFYKGLDVLLLAFERLLRRRAGGPYRLLVVGSLPDATWDHSLYGGLCRSLKIADSVQVQQNYVPTEDFGLYFAAADVVCFPYRHGSQSGALQLAYSYRKPVVATTVGSLPESVVEGQTGFLVRPEEPDELADALETILSDPERCRQMGEYAYQWAAEELSWDKIAQRTLRLYHELQAGATVSA